MNGQSRLTEFDEDLLHCVESAVQPGDEITTLSIKRINRISAVDRSGVWVETERSASRGSGPQLVPAWMIAAGWQRLRSNGTLAHQELLNDLNVKRSAFVCALLARFPNVVVRSTSPVVLGLEPNPVARDG